MASDEPKQPDVISQNTAEKQNVEEQINSGQSSSSTPVLFSAKSAIERLLSRTEQPTKPLRKRDSKQTPVFLWVQDNSAQRQVGPGQLGP